MSKAPAAPAPRLFRKSEIRHALGGISDATLYRLIRDGVVARPMRPSPGLTLWSESDVAAAVAKITETRDTGPRPCRNPAGRRGKAKPAAAA